MHFDSLTENGINDSQNQANLASREGIGKLIIDKTKKSKKCIRKCRASAQEETSIGDKFVAGARQVWDVAKVAGLATKGEETTIVDRIAKNLAQDIGHQN